MIEYEKLTKKQKHRFEDFLREAIFLTEEENSAIEHQIPMTQELFEQCLSSLVRIGSINGFNRLYDEFPEQAKVFDKKIEEDLKDIELPQYTPEEEQALWEKLKARIREKYGVDAI